MQTVRNQGPYRLHKADPHRPRQVHPTFGDAEAEAQRLVAMYPGSSFIICQEVARVTEGERGTRTMPDGGPAYNFDTGEVVPSVANGRRGH